MAKKKQKIEVKPRKSEDWEKMLNAVLNSPMDVSFFPKDGEVFISIKDESLYSIRLKKDGTWDLQ